MLLAKLLDTTTDCLVEQDSCNVTLSLTKYNPKEWFDVDHQSRFRN
jgi:hypothetical protein